MAEDDNSMWGCLKHIVDPDTDAPLSRAKLASETAGIVLGALDTTSQTCAITLCGSPHAPKHYDGMQLGKSLMITTT